jgi:hypothetical protein
MDRFFKARSMFVLVASIGLAIRGAEARPGPEEAGSADQVFRRRILPIFNSPDPSSCVQCHLAGVDLKSYILPSHERTFRSLRDQGLIDLDRPESSKILSLISMGEKDNPGAALIHEKTRRAEYEAFAAWIRSSARDPALRGLPPLSRAEQAGPSRPPEVIRHARRDRVLESFERNVWGMRNRCMDCHIEGSKKNDELRGEHGDRVTWMKAAGAEATMRRILERKLVDLEDPPRSLLLRKPLGEVKHGGGKKILKGDQCYRAFLAWIEDYARTVKDGYADPASLPDTKDEAERFPTETWIKIDGTPPEWGDRLLEVNLFAWDEGGGAWEKEPVATSDRVVWGKGELWQHSLTLLARSGTERARAWRSGAPRLRPGRYLLRVYVDLEGRLEKDFRRSLGPDDFVGEAEIESRWPEGYGSMTTVGARAVRRPPAAGG